jgi:Na+/H+-dicarboxylate symporter
MKLWKKVILGLVCGILAGIYLKDYVIYFKPIGDMFLRSITMVIAPVIFFVLVAGITGMSDPSSLGRVGVKATAAYLTTTFFATIFGISIALLLQPGVGINVHFGTDPTTTHTDQQFDVVAYFVNIIPDSAVGAFANGKILQVVFFSIFTAFTINKMGAAGNGLREGFKSCSKLVLQMINTIMHFAPFAAFSLISYVVASHGIDVIVSLSKLIFAVTAAMLLQYLVFGLLILVFCRISPMPFYKKSFDYQIVALSTSSSKASLATTMNVCRERLGVSESSTSFVLPLGASINMDGFAINLALCTIFFAQILGVELQIYDYMVIIFTSTLGSIGGAGIPGASLIMIPMVLSSVNLPIEGVAILAGVDPILDRLRTVINITGDATITLIVDHSEGTMDEERYYSNDF